MSITTSSYFNNKLNMPTGTYSVAGLNNAISRYEDEYLELVLGYELWDEFITAYAASLVEGADPLADKWTDLLTGAEFEFEYDGVTYTRKWLGFSNSKYISPIANYIYYKHRCDLLSNFNGVSESVINKENATNVNPGDRLIDVWNDMVKMTGETPSIYKLYDFPSDLDDYAHFNKEGSLYNFLLANKDTYTNWEFTPIFSMSVLSLF